MQKHRNETYFLTQAEALRCAYEQVNSKYIIDFPDRIWTEHVNYGYTVRYTLPLIVAKTGNPAKKCLHISLYRMDSGRYELTTYLQ